MPLTEEQQNVVNRSVELYVSQEPESYVQVNACAGSGKSHTLITIVDEVFKASGKTKQQFKSRYFAYSKKLANEALEKFKKELTDCSTIHSMAWHATVRQHSLQVVQGKLNTDDLRTPSREELKDMKYINAKSFTSKRKSVIIYHLNQFFLSKHASIYDYISSLDYEERDCEIEELMGYYFSIMAQGKMKCTHSFYQKFFHILLDRNQIKNLQEFDLLLYDEVGDANEVSLEIFKLLKAKVKVMVGDNLQNIFGFNNTVNGFKTMKEYGNLFTFTKSFRVSDNIASKIESFVQTFVDQDFKFSGMKYDCPKDNNMAFLSRTNATLVGKMIELDKMGKPYNLTKHASEIFKLPLALTSLKPGKDIDIPELSHIKKTVENYYDSIALQKKYSILGYIMSEHNDDIAIKSACSIILDHGPKTIWDTFYSAKNHAVGKRDHYITLSTLHTSKGLEWDTVEIADDLNIRLDKIISEAKEIMEYTNSNAKKPEDKITIHEAFTESQEQELLLAYVGFSRAKHKLINAKHLFAGKVIQ